MRGDVAALLAAIVLSGCAGPAARPHAGPSAAPASPRATSEPVHIETNSSGDRYITVVQRVTQAPGQSRIAYSLRAISSSADIVGADSVVTFVRPQITFNDRQGKRLVADSPQAKVTQRDKSVLMRGGVRARADDGSILTCDTLRYDGRTEQVHGEGHVALTGPTGLTLSGNYLDGDVRLDHVRVAQRPL